MVSAIEGSGWSPGREHSVVFLGKTLHSHSASHHPDEQMASVEFNAGVILQWTTIPSGGGVAIPLQKPSAGPIGHLVRMHTLP